MDEFSGMDELTALRRFGDRLGPVEVAPGAEVEARLRARIAGSGTGRADTGRADTGRADTGRSHGRPGWSLRRGGGAGAGFPWGVRVALPLATAAVVAGFVVVTQGLVPVRHPERGLPPAVTQVSTTSQPGTPPAVADGYVYTRIRFLERSFSAAKGWVEDSGTDETWLSADGRGAAVERRGHRAPADSGYSSGRTGWVASTALGPDERSGRPGRDLRGDVRFPWTSVTNGITVPALPASATPESVDRWFAGIGRAVDGAGASPAPLRVPTVAFGFGGEPGDGDLFALVPASAREAVFQAVLHRPGAVRREVTVRDGRTMIAIDGFGGSGNGDYPWHRMLFDPVSHAFAGVQYLLPTREHGAEAGTVVLEYVIEEQAVVDRPGRLPDGNTLPVGLSRSDLPAGDPALRYLGK